MMPTVIRMPEVLTGVAEAAIATWLAQVGQHVAVGAPLAEIETEKAVLEYVAEVEGTLLQVLVEEGATVTVGDPIAVVGAPDETVEPEASAPTASPAQHSPEQPEQPEPPTQRPSNTSAIKEQTERKPGAEASPDDAGTRLFATPLVRRLAAERGVDLRSVVGTGPNGRIVRRDLEDAVAVRSSPETTPPPGPAPVLTAPVAREYVEHPVTPMRRAIARRLTESKATVPHFYLTQDVRMDALLTLRRQANDGAETRVSVNDFVLKAVAGALRAVPEANATWAETTIRQHQQVDIAVAVAIDGGLVTPVLRGVDQRSVTEISRGVADMAERARKGRLKQHELEGGSFSVSNLGMYGTQEFSAIINPPHAGILAVGAAREAPVVDAGELSVATVMKVTLSADHRVVDGAVAAQWLAAFTALIENPLRMLV